MSVNLQSCCCILGGINQLHGPNFTQFWPLTHFEWKTWTFYILTTLCHVFPVDFLLTTYPLLLVHVVTEWPLTVSWVLKGNWVPPAFEGISFYQIHDSSPISFYFRSLASLSLFYVFHSVQHKRSMSCSFLLPRSSHEVVWKSEKSEFLHFERLPIYASGTWLSFFDTESSVTWCLT